MPPRALPSLQTTPTPHQDSCLSLSTTLLATLTNLILSIPPNQQSAPSSPPKDIVVLSIGSGTGLLEALLQAHLDQSLAPSPQGYLENPTNPPRLPSPQNTTKDPPLSQQADTQPRVKVEGVEVSPTTNLYLPPSSLSIVPGTYAIGDRATLPDVRVWLFVYPRNPGLVRKYLDLLVEDEGSEVEMVIWLGPRVDWDEHFRDCFMRTARKEGFAKVRWVDGESIGVGAYEGMGVIRRSRRNEEGS